MESGSGCIVWSFRGCSTVIHRYPPLSGVIRRYPALVSHEVEFLLSEADGFVADAALLGWEVGLGCLGGAVLELEFMDVAFDTAFSEPDHGVDELGELLRVSHKVVAESGWVGLSEEPAEVHGDDADDCLAVVVAGAGAVDDLGG